MLTVKHITLSGEEFVYVTSHVNYVPARAKSCAPASDSLWIYEQGEDDRAREISGGTVFVMNERGATVSRYDLGASDVPLGVASSPHFAGAPIDLSGRVAA